MSNHCTEILEMQFRVSTFLYTCAYAHINLPHCFFILLNKYQSDCWKYSPSSTIPSMPQAPETLWWKKDRGQNMTILSPKYNDHFLFGVWFGLRFFKGIRKRLSTCGSYIKKKKLNRKKRSEHRKWCHLSRYLQIPSECLGDWYKYFPLLFTRDRFSSLK